MEQLEGRVAVVTGAASGIGLALATRFAEEGMKVVLADIEAPALEAVVNALRQAEGDVIGVRTDASSYESVDLDTMYAASKHAVAAISEALYFQLHLVGSKLSASVLCPGFVQTNIVDSARNRPQNLRNEVSAADLARGAQFEAFMRGLIDNGRPPSDVAGMVVEAIRNDRFWIVTTKEFDPAISARVESIVERRNPPLGPPPG